MTSPTTDLAFGRFEGMREEEYNRLPHVRRSSLWKMASKGPANAKYYDTHPSVSTAAMAFGTAVHTLALEPSEFENRYAVGPDARRNSGAWIEFEACCKAEGRIPLKAKEYDEIRGVAESLLSEGAETSNFLSRGDGVSELTLTWEDPETALPLKARLDRLIELRDRCVVVELKTAQSADDDDFRGAIGRYGYHFQAAMYCEGIERVIGKPVSHWFWVVVEKTAPYWTNVMKIDEKSLEIGKSELRAALARWKECEDAGVWPDDRDRIKETGLLPWYRAKGITV